ncbi:MAG TPA: hypothetical protein VFJ96_00460, partial [Gemmatimonadaceae bacterium]|nr:hypothetical protein [Gemmatimonadaceae bacterium]
MTRVVSHRKGIVSYRKRVVSYKWILLAVVAASAASSLAAQNASSVSAQSASTADRLSLDANWRIQSSAKLTAGGAAITRAGFSTKGWYPATLPSTVLAALVADHVYPDPYFGMNLRKIPGTAYPIGTIFSRQEIPANSPFAVPWWFRRTFNVPASMRGKHLVLHFNGINYRANIWLNGRRIADSTQIAGAFRRYELDVTDFVAKNAENVLAVEIFAPTPMDLAPTWLNWNPEPPDKMMGLWHRVWLS